MERSTFLKYTAAAGASLMLHPFSSFATGTDTKIKVALVGTGSRGSGFWGRDLARNFPNLEFAGLCDINPGRVEYIKKYIGLFDERPYYGQSGYAATRYPFSTYAAMITYLDDQVGIILDRIKKLGLDENTVIMFSSDNGATFSAGVDTKFFNSVSGLRGLKMDLYEGGIREPFIARWPRVIPAGKTSDHISAQFDLMATLAELTGQTIPGKTDGISFFAGIKRKYGCTEKTCVSLF